MMKKHEGAEKMTNSFIINPRDDVVTVTKAISKGEDVKYHMGNIELSVKASEDIPQYHKVAVKKVKSGDFVLKYGEVIGYATLDIEVGDHVHVENLSDLVKKEDVNA